MTKSLANKIQLKERLDTFKMAEGTPVQKHLNDFNSIIVDLESLDVKIENENNAILLPVSLPSSYKHFNKILLYSNNDTLSFKDVKSTLLSKEKFDPEVRSDDKAKGLFVRGRSFEKEGTNRRNPDRSRKVVNPANSANIAKSQGIWSRNITN